MDLPSDYRVLIDRAEKMISSGEGKTAIKKVLRWSTVRKKLTTQEAREVEETIDRLLEARKEAVEGAVSRKDQRLRERRLRKMEELRADGCTVAQIRGRMNVRGCKKAWPRSEQDWFERQMENHAE